MIGAKDVSDTVKENVNDVTVNNGMDRVNVNNNVEGVKSYAKMVQKHEKLLDTSLDFKPTEVCDDGTEYVIFDEEIVAKGSKKWNLTVCGQFIGCSVNENELRYHVRRMWSKYGLIDVQVDRKGVCYFKFKNKEGLGKVIEQGP